MSRWWTSVPLLFCLLSVPTGVWAQQCVDPPTGMTAWWPGDGNPGDVYGTWDGSLVGGTTYAPGIVGDAFHFDGNDHVQVLDSEAGDFGSDPFTVDFWLYSNAIGTREYVIGKSNPNVGGAGWDIRLDARKIMVYGVDGWTLNITSDASATEGEWHHIALTATTSDAVLYVDGVLKGSSARTTIATDPSPLRFGDNPSYGDPGLNGLIDEVEFFDRALSEIEVQSIYNAGADGKCRPCAALPDDAIAWWRAEDDALDEIGTNNGTPTGDATWDGGRVGRAFSLDGNGDFILLPDDDLWDFGTGSFTVVSWFKTSVVGDRNIIRYHDGAGGTGLWGVRIDPNGKLEFLVNTSDGSNPINQVSTGAYADNDWHFVAAVRDADAGQLRISVDGSAAASPVSDGSVDIVAVAGTVPAIGAGVSGGGTPYEEFAGLIDEVAIFGRALTVDEIQSLANAGGTGACTGCTEAPSDLVSLWRGDDTADDAVGFNDGTLQNGATFATGRVGSAISLPAGSDYVEVPHSESLSFGSTDPMSIDLWVKRTSTADTQHIFGKRDDCVGTPFNYQMVWIESSDVLCFGYGDPLCTTADRLPLDTWTHVAVTFDGSVGRFYVNGQPEASASMTLGPDTNSPALRLGTSSNCHDSGEGFGGLLDEVEVHDRGLSRDEVAAIYNAGGFGKCALDLVPDAFTFTDQSGIALSSTQSSGPITVTGIDVRVSIVIDSCTGGACEYSINGGSWTAAAGTVAGGDQVEVRQTSAATYGTTTDLVLDIGGVIDTFSVTTLQQFTLTVSVAGGGSGVVTSSPAGIDCGGDCSELFVEGTVVTLTATEDLGSFFSGWSGDADCTDGEVTVTGTVQCTATFGLGLAEIFADGFETSDTSAWAFSVGGP